MLETFQHNIGEIVRAFPVPSRYLLLEGMTAGFSAAKHPLAGFALLDTEQPAADQYVERLIDWECTQTDADCLASNYIEYPKLPGKLAELRKMIENMGFSYAYTTEAFRLPMARHPKVAAAELSAIFGVAVAKGIQIVSHNAIEFFFPFYENLMYWTKGDPTSIQDANIYDTSVVVRGALGNVLPESGEPWPRYVSRVLERRGVGKFNLQACQGLFSIEPPRVEMFQGQLLPISYLRSQVRTVQLLCDAFKKLA